MSHYDGAGHGRRFKSWIAPSTGPVDSVVYDLPTLRNRVRDAVRNDAVAAAIVRTWTSGLVGSGVVARSPGDDATIRHKVDAVWNEWMPNASPDGNFYGLQVLAVRSMIESGECFLRIRPRLPSDDLAVPVQIELMESDCLPLLDRALENGNRMVQGIEVDKSGQIVAYHFYRQHPGDRHACDETNLVRVSAAYISHVFMPVRPGQMRGVSILTPVLARLRSLGNYDDAVLFRQEIANLFVGFIEKAPSSGDAAIDPVSGKAVTADYNGTPMAAMEPGTMQELFPGETIKFSVPPDAGANYADFIRAQYQAIATGVGVPYEMLIGDLRDVTDRTLRVSLNEWRRLLEAAQWTTVIPKVCQFVRDAWADAALMAGVLNAKEAGIARRAEWTPPRHRYIHPVQDVQSMREELEAGFRSRAAIIAELGYDIADVDAERAADAEREIKLGLGNKGDAVDVRNALMRRALAAKHD